MQIAPLESICMKWQILFSGKIRKNIINFSSAEFVQRVVKVKQMKTYTNNSRKSSNISYLFHSWKKSTIVSTPTGLFKFIKYQLLKKIIHIEYSFNLQSKK